MAVKKGYFPSISTRVGEFLAYDLCDAAIKDAMMPIVTLTRYEETESFADAAHALVGGLDGRPAIVDFDAKPRIVTSAAEAVERRRRAAIRRAAAGQNPARPRSERELANDAERTRKTVAFNDNLQRLLDPKTGPTAWLEMTRALPELTPVVRLLDRESLWGQLDFMSDAGRRSAIRVRVDERLEVDLVVSVAEIIRSNVGSIDLIVDADNIWGRSDLALAKASSLLERLETEIGDRFAELRIILLSTSFPKVALKTVPNVLRIEELILLENLGRRFDVHFGDYGSLPNRTEDVIARGWFPHVDLVTRDRWHIELIEVNRSAAGYIAAAGAIRAKPEWRERADCWGAGSSIRSRRGSRLSKARSSPIHHHG
ncbi:hypothetical protein [Rhizobium sp. BG4]|uniref:beta family protein n=1 Tax=Rhizobium sp. BG4 TaxID=2613770 RepID=UPI00193D7DC6|nr:hypothetical protein [Rhizobium sp. BG4]QRM45774.1 hypothetical protein F2982_20315 [Rhizobium sp. BG4]